mgnify:FL=1
MKERCRGRSGQPLKPQGTGIPEHTIINQKGGKEPREIPTLHYTPSHTYRMERLPGIEPRYKREGLPYSYHINKDTKEKIASGLKFTIRQKSGNPGSCLPQAPGFSPLLNQNPVRSHHIAVRGCGVYKQASHGPV